MKSLIYHNSQMMALGGHLFLLLTILIWNTWIEPPQTLPRVLPIILLGLPLLIVLPGLLKQKSSALYASCLLALVYFSIGITNIASNAILYGALQILSSVLWFSGSALCRQATANR